MMVFKRSSTPTRRALGGLVVAAMVACVSMIIEAKNSHVRKITNYDEYTEAINDGKVYITAYKASWCGHCKKLAPVWEELAAALKDDPSVVVAEVECPDAKKICDEVGVKGFPTIASSFGGEKKEVFKGARTRGPLEKFARSQGILWMSETVQ